MGSTQIKGNAAEELACEYLQRHGLDLIERNFRCRYGEVDLVMRHQDTIVFVEVRFRKQHGLVDGLQSVDHNKQRKLINSANHYLQINRLSDNTPARIDVIAVSMDATRHQFDWVQNAVQAG